MRYNLVMIYAGMVSLRVMRYRSGDDVCPVIPSGDDVSPVKTLLDYSMHVLRSLTSLTRIPPEQGLLAITLLATLTLCLLLTAPAARARLQLPLQLLLDKLAVALRLLA